jgi:cardiolipin synthase (CMP-forming)
VAFPFCVTRPTVAVTLLVVAAATDVVDGWLARRRGETTAIGALLDPIADKIFVAVVIATLVVAGLMPVWAVGLLLTREIGQVGLLISRIATFDEKSTRKPPPASLPGKLTTALQFVSMATAFVVGSWVPPLFALTAVVGVIAAFGYWSDELCHVAERG